MAQRLRNPIGIHEVLGSIPGLAPWVKDLSCGIGRRHSSDSALLWLWPRTAATARIRLNPAWESPRVAGAALKKTKKKKKKSQCGQARE